MEYSWTFYRDHIVLNKDFASRHKLAVIQIGTTILLAARKISVDGTFALDGRDIVLLADYFDGSQGSIQVKSLIDGQAGPKVTVVCRQLAGIHMTSTGAVGLEGAPGAPGKPGRSGRPAALPNKPGGPGGPGGKGGTGGPGGVGGSGGDITLVYKEDISPGGLQPAHLQVPGGPGGPGGEGGPGGPGGIGGPGNPDGADGADGPAGDQGPMGPVGIPGSVHISQVTEAEYWHALRPLAAQWAAYRLRMGEYYFRAYNPSGLPTSEYLDLALSECNAVLQIDPGNVQAALYTHQLLHHQNVLGLARDIDIIPDFAYYEQVLTQYGPLVLSLFEAASSLLLGNLTLEQMRQTLTREIAHIEGLALVLEAERSAAERNKLAAEAEQQMAVKRVRDNEDRIRARRQELENKQIGWSDVLTFGAFTVWIGIITLATGGTGAGALLAAIPEVLALGGVDFGPLPEKNRTDILSKAQGLKSYTAAKQNVPGSIMPLALSFAKMIKDLEEAQGDADLIKLLKEVVELTHAQRLTQIRHEQANFTLQAATLKLEQALRDLALAQSQLGGLVADQAFLEQVALTLMRSAQRSMDMLIKYAFLAARSLEIYTLADLSNELHFDYGYIHPDLEQDYQDHLLPLAQLIGAYQTSWSRFIGIVNYRNNYDNYFSSGNKVNDKVFLTITDPLQLSQFRQTQNLLVTVDLQDLPPTRFEAKAIYVLLSLTGATANVPAISCLVEHAGRFTTRKRNGTTTSLILRPRLTVVQTAKTALTYTGVRIGASPQDLSFWGRGVATTWQVSIEPDEMARRQIDLSGLSTIEIEIGYEAFV